MLGVCVRTCQCASPHPADAADKFHHRSSLLHQLLAADLAEVPDASAEDQLAALESPLADDILLEPLSSFLHSRVRKKKEMLALITFTDINAPPKSETRRSQQTEVGSMVGEAYNLLGKEQLPVLVSRKVTERRKRRRM